MSMDAKTLYELLNKIIDSHQIEEICLLPYQNALSKDQYYPFLLIGSNLGIPLEHLHKIFKQAHGIFMNLYVDRNQGYSNDKLIAYINNDDKEAIELIKQSTRCLLLLNPDFYTATNARKKLILNNLLDPSEELKFINLIFTFPKHTKNSTIWHHRYLTISCSTTLASPP